MISVVFAGDTMNRLHMNRLHPRAALGRIWAWRG